MPATALGPGNPSLNKKEKDSCPHIAPSSIYLNSI